MKHKHLIKVGIIGAGLMGKAHVLGYLSMPRMFPDPPAEIELWCVADISEALARAAAQRLGFRQWTANYRELLADEAVEVVSIVTPNSLHHAMAIDAALAGKHIICEKPLARTHEESAEMLEAVSERPIVHGVNFNYRRVPAVSLAKSLVMTGAIGEPLHFRGWYLQDFALDEDLPWSWKFSRQEAGSGSLGGIGSHVIDLARWILGEIDEVVGWSRTVVPERPLLSDSGTSKPVDVDDQIGFLCRFASGATGSIEASRCSSGYKNAFRFEIEAKEGAIRFDYERPGELQISHARGGVGGQSFEIYRPGPQDPYGQALWPLPGMGTGFSDTMALQIYEFVSAVVNGYQFDPSFADGHRVCCISDAVRASVESGSWTSTHGKQ